MKDVAVINDGFLGKRKLALILALIFLFGCIIPMTALIPSVVADVPSATGSHLAYWHFQDSSGHMWANTNPDDTDDSGTTEREETHLSPTNVGYGFAVRANMNDDSILDEALYFEENGQIDGDAWVDLSTSIGTNLPTEITFYAENIDGSGTTLNTWLTTVNYRDDGKYTFGIEIIDGAVIPAGNQLVLGINFEAQTGITTITFHTSGESWFNLPLVEGSNGGDGDGGDGDGDGDGDGGDGNATNGDEEDNSTVLMIIVVVIIVLVLIAVVVGLKRRG